VLELADNQDLKSCGLLARAGASPASGTIKIRKRKRLVENEIKRRFLKEKRWKKKR
jgi:hypothetical protein